MERRKTTIGMAVDECIRETTEEWFRQHAGMRSREEAAANDIKSVETKVERLKRGKLTIIVTVKTNKASQLHAHYCEFQLSGKLGYVQNEPTKKR